MAEESELSLGEDKNHFIYSKEWWQYPAITEKHAAQKLITLLSPDKDRLYFAFPWATLFDMIDFDNDKLAPVKGILDAMRKKAIGKKRVVTTCQHIMMRRHHEFMKSVGITDIFWSHSEKGLDHIGGMKIHPFPLFPVLKKDSERPPAKYLFSFVGAKTSESRLNLIKILGNEVGGLMMERPEWHYGRIVYGKQVKKKNTPEFSEATSVEMKEKEREYSETLISSQFSLCPRGTGPNTIRLWESVEFGSIPVIISDDHRLPGAANLWREAAVFVKEDSIGSIPSILRKIAKNKESITRMQDALRCIKIMYGRESFVTDIVKHWAGGDLQSTDAWENS